MEFTAQELTKLLTETKKARESLDKVLDFVDLINKRLDDLPDSVRTSGEGIRQNAEEIGKYIEEISNHKNDLLLSFTLWWIHLKKVLSSCSIFSISLSKCST